MDRGTILLNGLRSQLVGWLDVIRRGVGATDISIVQGGDGEFTVHVEWTTKGGELQSFDKPFTRQEVFGASYGHTPLTWRVQRRACDYARDIMRQILSARGV